MSILIFIIVWLLLGIIATWRMYHGTLKSWYIRFNESYWKYHDRNGDSAIHFLVIFSPLLILGGMITFILHLIDKEVCWWFTTKNK